MESILTSVKKMLGITEDYEHFDPELIMHINSVINVLAQLGVGPEEGYSISSKADEWAKLIGDTKLLELVKSYVYLKEKLLFDPPLASSTIEACNRQIDELEYRINLMAEHEKTIKNEDE